MRHSESFSKFDANTIHPIKYHCRWADKLESENSAGDAQPFNHPFLQACTMFIGESLCLLVFSISHFAKKRKQVSYVYSSIFEFLIINFFYFPLSHSQMNWQL